jgi:hypothetical protein
VLHEEESAGRSASSAATAVRRRNPLSGRAQSKFGVRIWNRLPNSICDRLDPESAEGSYVSAGRHLRQLEPLSRSSLARRIRTCPAEGLRRFDSRRSCRRSDAMHNAHALLRPTGGTSIHISHWALLP